MRLVTYAADGRQGVGVMEGEAVAPIGAFPDMVGLIAAGNAGLAAAHAALAGSERIATSRLLAPIPRPGKLLCCGVNYCSHGEENPNAVLPTEPFFFSKLPTAVIGPDDPIVKPFPECQLDWEVEFAAVIGKEARRLNPANALDHVVGYTLLHDV